MRIVGIIPVRMQASRFPGKPMAKLQGMPMVAHCYYRTCLALGEDNVYVATCDEEIASYVCSIGGKSIMTADTHKRATTRSAEAMTSIEKSISDEVDIVVMVQGDEPLISPLAIKETINHFNDQTVSIVNIMTQLTEVSAIKDRNNVKVVVDKKNNALYFSREPIPSLWQGCDDGTWYMQTGVIAFRRQALLDFNELEETKLEIVESIDMNRILETGGEIRMVLMNSNSIGVDTPEELKQAETLLTQDPFVRQYIV